MPTANAQTVSALYSDSTNQSYFLFYAYDYQTNSAVRIDSRSEILLVVNNVVFKGRPGESRLASSEPAKPLYAHRIASQVMPQLILNDIETVASLVQADATGPLGGPTLTGRFPQGNRLMPIEEYPDPSRVSFDQVLYDLDAHGRLAQIRYPESDRKTVFDLAVNSTKNISYLNSLSDGGWVLEEFIVHPDHNSIFKSDQVIALARELAFRSAALKSIHDKVHAATSAGRNQLAQSRDVALGTDGPHVTQRFALIITGLIVIAVGSLAWWKNRS